MEAKMSTKSIARRAGTTAELSLFSGVMNEITVDTTKKVTVVHDGTTMGGFPMAREDLTNAVVVSGATSVASGIKGLVPQPLAGDQDKVLYGDGTWKSIDWSTVINEPFIPQTFLDLPDTPNTYTGSEKYALTVNEAGSAIEFTAIEPSHQVKYQTDANTITVINDKYQIIVWDKYVVEANATLDIQPGACLVIL